MATIDHRLAINAPSAKVYDVISTSDGIGTWSDKQTACRTDRGVVLKHNPGPEHGVVKLRVVELVPNNRVEWECISTHPKTVVLPRGLVRTSFSRSLKTEISPPRPDRSAIRTAPPPWIFAGWATKSTASFSDRTTSLRGRCCRT